MLALGTSECSNCGMKFKVKALKQRGDASKAEEQSPYAAEAPEEPSRAACDLIEAANGLIAEKSAILSRLVNRRAKEKKRLSQVDLTASQPEVIEAEMVSLVDDLEDVSRLHSEMLSISELVLAASETMVLGDDAKAKVQSMTPLAPAPPTSGGEDIAAKEEQIAKREEMVDNKIKDYAIKKKQLN